MDTEQKMVNEFRHANGLPVAWRPRNLSLLEGELHAELIRSEVDELLAAVEAGDIEEQYDAFEDILYLALGGISNMGLIASPGFAAVHASNMSKLGEDGKPIIAGENDPSGEPAGKVLKGPNYFKVDHSEIIAHQDRILDGEFWSVRP